MRSSPSPHKRRAADPNACEGSVLVNFGGMHIYPMRSCLNPDLPATTLYITDVPDQLDLGFHPIHGQKGSPRVYRGWFYRAARDGASDEGEVAVKWVRGIRRIEALERERENYCRLLELQGVVIPHLWDYMEATIEGVDVACLVIEWCGEPHPEDPRLFSAQKLELAVLLHKEGWSHGDLLDVDSHHFVVAEDDETGNPLRLVDLTKASEHRCVFEDPECCMKPNPGGCRELDTLAAMRLLNL
ncbi:uncharacterized protein C8Q71DRAFT_862973 [Rhodofomes roseus]|uniref:Protein kinase domain-containing protein n=1 Tax=Rhodofomes roseus TaxID=34475 RepID=A0ABQ8K0D6_9APHY|nr:uncharacterized protein C8Q71DRAFT_862973 [Rhodofomes roseus]KAH9829877.1 hypothetical protein C8Q71DRAFT_862973 [Rhodofomes roseus]